MPLNVRTACQVVKHPLCRKFSNGYPEASQVTALLEEHFVIIFLVLFAGVLFWAFRPRKQYKNQKDTGNPSSRDEDAL